MFDWTDKNFKNMPITCEEISNLKRKIKAVIEKNASSRTKY